MSIIKKLVADESPRREEVKIKGQILYVHALTDKQRGIILDEAALIDLEEIRMLNPELRKMPVDQPVWDETKKFGSEFMFGKPKNRYEMQEKLLRFSYCGRLMMVEALRLADGRKCYEPDDDDLKDGTPIEEARANNRKLWIDLFDQDASISSAIEEAIKKLQPEFVRRLEANAAKKPSGGNRKHRRAAK